MLLAFSTKELRTLCEQPDVARAQLGLAASEALVHRLADLIAATTIDDIIAGRPRALEDDPFSMRVDLADGYVLAFAANHPKLRDLGTLTWTKVSRVKILEIQKIDA